ncbi:hypothetical protein GDO81_021038 [Engystomops pustulosus]|uniref:Uncharacterized protein n=1 Tax=Engystomops pustulosus TaxID=76066 RepID=A0AAV6YWJ1_ENGPU|nr:hypothetical protein GDO81_021038 [Engystomops pustulosus]
MEGFSGSHKVAEDDLDGKRRKRQSKEEGAQTGGGGDDAAGHLGQVHLPHKAPGEEYRVTGYGGWSWISKTHVHRSMPRFPGNTNVNYRKALDKTQTETESADKKKDEEPDVKPDQKEETDHKDQSKDLEHTRTMERMLQDEDSCSTGKGLDDLDPVKDEPMEDDASSVKEEGTFPDADLINVSLGFQMRTWYKKKVKASRLDVLLERRERQFTYEEKQRLERLKQGDSTKETSSPQQKSDNLLPGGGRLGVVRKLDMDSPGDVTQTSTEPPADPPSSTDRAAQNNDVPDRTEETKDEAPATTDSGSANSQAEERPEESPSPEPVSDKSVPPEEDADSMDMEHPEDGPEQSTHGAQKEGPTNEADYLQNKEEVIAPQVNGKDIHELSDHQSLPEEEPKVNNVSVPLCEHGTKLKDPAGRALMNGDISMEEEEEDKNGSPGGKDKAPNCEEQYPGAPSAPQSLTNSIDGAEDPEKTPVTSPEESSLSNDSTEQNTGNGEAKTQTVVTEVTTTTTTVSTTRTVVAVCSDSSKQEVSSAENTCMSSTTTVTKVTAANPSGDGVVSVKEQSKTVTTATVSDSVTTPNGSVSSMMTISKEYSTKDRVRLVKFSKPKKSRSGTALPSYRKFVTKSSKKSIFVLPNDDLKKLSRRGGIREVPYFSYNAKPVHDIWPYPSPRPTFGITWRYRLQTVKSLAGVSLMLRLLWASLRWDDMAAKPPPGGGITRTESSETEIITTEIIKRRDVGPYGIRSEYCIRKIICPIGVPEAPKETPTPQRKGLRSSALRPKRPETPKQTGPIILETWVTEDELELWEIKCFSERVEKEKIQSGECRVVDLKKGEDGKSQMDAQLKQQRLLVQQKRLEQQKQSPLSATATTGSTLPTLSTPQKVVMGSLPGSVTPGTKVMLATKVASPATVSFQQNKNFHQTFATWVKQGQTTSGVVQVQQKVFIPSTTGVQQTFTTFQPRTTTVSIRANNIGTTGTTTTTQQVRA